MINAILIKHTQRSHLNLEWLKKMQNNIVFFFQSLLKLLVFLKKKKIGIVHWKARLMFELVWSYKQWNTFSPFTDNTEGMKVECVRLESRNGPTEHYIMPAEFSSLYLRAPTNPNEDGTLIFTERLLGTNQTQCMNYSHIEHFYFKYIMPLIDHSWKIGIFLTGFEQFLYD